MKTTLTTITVNGIEYAGIKGNMSDAAFKSMVVRNNMTADKMVKLLNRGL
jgi:hypothetical protein